MGQATRVALAAAVLGLCGMVPGAPTAAATEETGGADWVEVMEIKVKAVDIQNKAAELLDKVSSAESKQKLRDCIDQAQKIFNTCEMQLLG